MIAQETTEHFQSSNHNATPVYCQGKFDVISSSVINTSRIASNVDCTLASRTLLLSLLGLGKVSSLGPLLLTIFETILS